MELGIGAMPQKRHFIGRETTGQVLFQLCEDQGIWMLTVAEVRREVQFAWKTPIHKCKLPQPHVISLSVRPSKSVS